MRKRIVNGQNNEAAAKGREKKQNQSGRLVSELIMYHVSPACNAPLPNSRRHDEAQAPEDPRKQTCCRYPPIAELDQASPGGGHLTLVFEVRRAQQRNSRLFGSQLYYEML